MLNGCQNGAKSNGTTHNKNVQQKYIDEQDNHENSSFSEVQKQVPDWKVFKFRGFARCVREAGNSSKTHEKITVNPFQNRYKIR